ncbi:unnamed protein product [Amoebophrya sp. A25]|nr:unnamed protein product [Amoebophrya sp. A25]|eukprot:GSA25T00002294001.1
MLDPRTSCVAPNVTWSSGNVPAGVDMFGMQPVLFGAPLGVPLPPPFFPQYGMPNPEGTPSMQDS